MQTENVCYEVSTDKILSNIEQRCGHIFTYLSHEMSYERVIGVLLFQTAVNVADDWHYISSAQKMNHSIQNCFLELKLKSK